MKNSKTLLKLTSITLASATLLNSSFASAATDVKPKKSSIIPKVVTGILGFSAAAGLAGGLVYESVDSKKKSEKLEKLEKQRKDLETKLKKAEEEKSAEYKKLKKQCDDLETQRKKLEIELTNIKDKNSEEYNELKQKFDNLANKHKDLEEKLKKVEAEKSDEFDKLKKEYEELEDQCKRLKAELQAVKTELESAEAQRKDLEEKLKKAETEESKDHCQKLESEPQLTKDELGKAKAQLTELEGKLAEKSNECTELYRQRDGWHIVADNWEKKFNALDREYATFFEDYKYTKVSYNFLTRYEFPRIMFKIYTLCQNFIKDSKTSKEALSSIDYLTRRTEGKFHTEVPEIGCLGEKPYIMSLMYEKILSNSFTIEELNKSLGLKIPPEGKNRNEKNKSFDTICTHILNFLLPLHNYIINQLQTQGDIDAIEFLRTHILNPNIKKILTQKSDE